MRAVFATGTDAHAILFFGEEGVGKSELSKRLIRFWLCHDPSPQGACGVCRSCVSLERGVASDLLSIFPRGPSRWIHVAAIREVKQRPLEYEDVMPADIHLRTPPIRSRRKAVWIEDVDRMSAEASNALLKTLEEPPEQARFVLTTTAIGRVRPTIRSRCLAVPCELPTFEDWRAAYPNLEEWEEVLAQRSPGRLARLRESAEVYRGAFELALDTLSARTESALALTRRLRALVDALNKSDDLNSRLAGTLVLQALATSLGHFGASKATIARVVESHRRTGGNASAGVEFDALFAGLLSPSSSKPGTPSGVLA